MKYITNVYLQELLKSWCQKNQDQDQKIRPKPLMVIQNSLSLFSVAHCIQCMKLK